MIGTEIVGSGIEKVREMTLGRVLQTFDLLAYKRIINNRTITAVGLQLLA